jgi:hypothetical protein
MKNPVRKNETKPHGNADQRELHLGVGYYCLVLGKMRNILLVALTLLEVNSPATEVARNNEEWLHELDKQKRRRCNSGWSEYLVLLSQ